MLCPFVLNSFLLCRQGRVPVLDSTLALRIIDLPTTWTITRLWKLTCLEVWQAWHTSALWLGCTPVASWLKVDLVVSLAWKHSEPPSCNLVGL